MKRNWTTAILGGLIIVLVLFAYWPALHGGFIWDDDDYVTNNTSLHNLAGLGQIWSQISATPQYYPLVYSTFWFEYRLWGLNPLGFHLANVLLQILAAVLLWRVLVQLQVPCAWLAAGIFALHPVMVESVAWITERKNVLSGTFYFASALMYLRFVSLNGIEVSPVRSAAESRSAFWQYYLPALMFFLAALLSKTVTASMPAALLLVIYWKRGRITVRDISWLLPFFIAGVSFGLVTAWIELTHVGASGVEWSLTGAERCLVAGRAVWFYAGKLVWPADLSFIYPRWQINSQIWWQWLFPFSAVALVIVLWCLRRRIGRGPLVAILFFGGTLFPALGFLNVYPMRFSFVADHFQYLASVGLITLAAVGWAKICPRANWTAALLLLILAGLTWRQAQIYRDIKTLWLDTLAKNPGCWLACNNLGHELSVNGQGSEAIDYFDKAIRLNPNYAEAHYNLGCEYVRKGWVKEAAEQFEQTILLKWDLAEAHNNLGGILVKNGQLEKAISHFQTAVQLQPGFASAHYNLGVALYLKNDTKDAVGQFETTIRLQPDFGKAQSKLGAILLNQGRTNEAIGHFQEAVRLDPNDEVARNGLTEALKRGQRGN